MYKNNIIGWFAVGDCHALSILAKQVPENGIIVEVGSLFGKSSVSLAENAHPSVKIYCIDLFNESLVPNNNCEYNNTDFPIYKKTYNAAVEFKKNTATFSNIIMIKGSSPQCFTDDTEIAQLRNIDLFFLDASHFNPNDWENIEFFLPRIKRNGIISGHDFYENKLFPDVNENVEKLEKQFQQTVTQYKYSSVWSFRIP